MKRILKILCFTLLGAIVLCAGYIFSLKEWKAFDPAVLREAELSLRLYDKDNMLYLTLDGGEDRIACDFAALPAAVKNAFICVEDARFYDHCGIDPVRIGGALITDLKTMSLREGASTITQQLVKLSVLTGEKTLARKCNEILMALKTELYYSKDAILELYLNRVYFGRGAYGIEAAALAYFGKSAPALTLSEAATLAGIINSPTTYAPHRDLEKCTARRNLVLGEMRKNGAISEAEYQNALQQKITVIPAADSYLYGFYTDYVLRTAAELLDCSITELRSGGYRIETALDRGLQESIEALTSEDANFPEPAADGLEAECAVVAENAKTGLVCALVGGREHTAQLGFSRATDMRRQPGSAIKPVLVFTPALEYENYSTTTFLFDQPMSFDGYAPRNAGRNYRGWLTLRDTVAYSVNIPTVALFETIGIEQCIAYASSVGIPFAAEDDNLSLALGGFTEGVTPMELAGAYQPFANGGSYTPPSPIRRILSAAGKVLYDAADIAAFRAISENTAYLMSSMLSSAVEYGTAKNVALDAVPLCAKTGTTSYDDADNNKDAWIVAYNPEYIVCTWMGFDKTDAAHSLKKGETGGAHPALLTKQIFAHLYETRTAPRFTRPVGIEKVYLDARALSERFATVPISAAAQDAVAEYFTAENAPRRYENDDPLSQFVYKEVQPKTSEAIGD